MSRLCSVVQRRAKQWFVTVGPLEYYDSIRRDFLLYYEDIEEYCVSIETNSTNKANVHLHAYLKFYDLVTFEYVKECLPVSVTINVQQAKSRRNVLKYITKEDENPEFNMSPSELSFAYRARSWARNTQTFRFYDPFVLEHPQYYRVLLELHKEITDRRRYKAPVVPHLSTWYPGWAMRMYEAVISFIKRQTTRQVYLYGPSGTGKTFTLSLLLRELGLSNAYMPVPGQFFFGDFTNSYDCVMFEEFDFDRFKLNFSQIKRLLNAERFSVDVKGSRQRIIVARCPVFFVSNFEPPYDRAFTRRIEIIHAVEEMEGKARIAVPKEEPDAPPSYIEISSDSESEDEETPPISSWKVRPQKAFSQASVPSSQEESTQAYNAS